MTKNAKPKKTEKVKLEKVKLRETPSKSNPPGPKPPNASLLVPKKPKASKSEKPSTVTRTVTRSVTAELLEDPPEAKAAAKKTDGFADEPAEGPDVNPASELLEKNLSEVVGAIEDIDPLEKLADEIPEDLPMDLDPIAKLDDEHEEKTTESSAGTSKALAPTDSVALYLAEIRKYPLLTREQEHALAVRYRETGDPTAAEALVKGNLRFVVKIAAEYTKFGAKLIDLVQEGNVGLMHAVKEFNPYKGVKLITYAVWWIRGYIQEYLMRQYSLVRIGTTSSQRKLFYRLQKERDALERLGHGNDIALLSDRLGVSREEIEIMSQRLKGRDISLNQPLDPDSRTTLLDQEFSTTENADTLLEQNESLHLLRENIEKIRPQLNEREIFLLEKRLLADEPMTLQEVGDHYGVTREAVRQVESRLMEKIRSAMLLASERPR